jgi:hypothetical protein
LPGVPANFSIVTGASARRIPQSGRKALREEDRFILANAAVRVGRAISSRGQQFPFNRQVAELKPVF